MGDVLALHCAVALHVAGATGGPSPAQPLAPGAPGDALACFAGPAALAALGVPPHVAAAYEARLRGSLHQPKDARAAFVDVARAMRAAAGLRAT